MNNTNSKEVLAAGFQAVEELIVSATKPDPNAMSTLKQIEANRRNSLNSTGPNTPEGKAVACQNPLKHGLRSRTLLMPEEDNEEFAGLCLEYRDWFQPQGLEERNLVEMMVSNWWKAGRVNVVEQGLYDKSRRCVTIMAKGEPQSAEQILLEVGRDADYQRALNLAHQMEARLDRAYQKAARELRLLQKARNFQPGAQPATAATEQPEPAAPPASPEITQLPSYSPTQLLTYSIRQRPTQWPHRKKSEFRRDSSGANTVIYSTIAQCGCY